MEELLCEFDALFRSEHAHSVTPAWIDAYAASRVLETARVQEAVVVPGRIEARPVQVLALAELA